MGTYTSNLSLYKPAASEQDWHDLVNDNFDTLDTLATSGGDPAYDLIRFVDYQNGSDTNDGRSRSAAMQTIQAAYNDLKTYALANYTQVGSNHDIGRIELAPGDHDVGAGVLIDGMNPCEIRGFRSNLYYITQPSQSRIVSSSSSATYLLKFDPTPTSTVGRGGRVYDVSFMPNSTTNSALTKCIWSYGMVNFHVERCGFRNGAGTSTENITAIYCDSSGDSSWHRIFNNNSGNMQFVCYAGGPEAGGNPSGGNNNRHVINHNASFFSGTNPVYQLNGEFFESSVCFNEIEGDGMVNAIELGPRTTQRGSKFDYNTFIGNVGESSTDTPYYNFLTHDNGTAGANHNIIIGGSCSADTFGTWAEFSAACGSNIVIGTVSELGISGQKAKIVDNSTAQNNLIINPTLGVIPKMRTRTTGTTLVAGDSLLICDASGGAFTVTPPTAVGIKGKIYTIKRINATNNVTIDPNGSQTIDGASTKVLTTQYQTERIISDGANWHLI